MRYPIIPESYYPRDEGWRLDSNYFCQLFDRINNFLDVYESRIRLTSDVENYQFVEDADGNAIPLYGTPDDHTIEVYDSTMYNKSIDTADGDLEWSVQLTNEYDVDVVLYVNGDTIVVSPGSSETIEPANTDLSGEISIGVEFNSAEEFQEIRYELIGNIQITCTAHFDDGTTSIPSTLNIPVIPIRKGDDAITDSYAVVNATPSSIALSESGADMTVNGAIIWSKVISTTARSYEWRIYKDGELEETHNSEDPDDLGTNFAFTAGTTGVWRFELVLFNGADPVFSTYADVNVHRFDTLPAASLSAPNPYYLVDECNKIYNNNTIFSSLNDVDGDIYTFELSTKFSLWAGAKTEDKAYYFNLANWDEELAGESDVNLSETIEKLTIIKFWNYDGIELRDPEVHKFTSDADLAFLTSDDYLEINDCDNVIFLITLSDSYDYQSGIDGGIDTGAQYDFELRIANESIGSTLSEGGAYYSSSGISPSGLPPSGYSASGIIIGSGIMDADDWEMLYNEYRGLWDRCSVVVYNSLCGGPSGPAEEVVDSYPNVTGTIFTDFRIENLLTPLSEDGVFLRSDSDNILSVIENDLASSDSSYGSVSFYSKQVGDAETFRWQPLSIKYKDTIYVISNVVNDDSEVVSNSYGSSTYGGSDVKGIKIPRSEIHTIAYQHAYLNFYPERAIAAPSDISEETTLAGGRETEFYYVNLELSNKPSTDDGFTLFTIVPTKVDKPYEGDNIEVISHYGGDHYSGLETEEMNKPFYKEFENHDNHSCIISTDAPVDRVDTDDSIYSMFAFGNWNEWADWAPKGRGILAANDHKATIFTADGIATSTGGDRHYPFPDIFISFYVKANGVIKMEALSSDALDVSDPVSEDASAIDLTDTGTPETLRNLPWSNMTRIQTVVQPVYYEIPTDDSKIRLNCKTGSDGFLLLIHSVTDSDDNKFKFPVKIFLTATTYTAGSWHDTVDWGDVGI